MVRYRSIGTLTWIRRPMPRASHNYTGAAQPSGTNAPTTQSVSVLIAGSGNDTFVFKQGFGAEIIANATHSDTIELDGFSSVTSINELQTLLNEVQNGQPQSMFKTANGGRDTVIDLGNHDSITLERPYRRPACELLRCSARAYR